MLGPVRRFLGLPRRRFRADFAADWLALSDGVRLATAVVRPREVASGSPAVLIRTAQPAHARSHLAWIFARLLAESGYCVVLQECRGRWASEGEFVPFENEARDGAETIDWIAEQPWFDGRLALVGFRYSGFAAWAALSRAAERVSALVVGFAARDPHAGLYTGGAFELANGLRWTASHCERQDVGERRLDLARGLPFRPVREADRVTLRRVDWFREWLDHPRPDAFWGSRTPPLPARLPYSLLLAGWYDPALRAQLADYAALKAEAEQGGGPVPEFVVGPWLAGRPPRGARPPRGEGALALSLRETLAFLNRHLRGAGARRGPVRLFVGGERRWREAPAWPLPQARERRLHLRSGGRANSSGGDGRLDEQAPPEGETVDRFTYDPSDPVPTRGGCLLGRGGGSLDQRRIEARADVLCYTTAPLSEGLVVVGPVRVVLFAASNAPDTDFTAKLVDVGADGVAVNLCDGVARCRWREAGADPAWLESDAPVRLAIDLWATALRLPAGHRLRLEISSSNFPRFDRNANTRAAPTSATAEESAPAKQTVFHDAPHPSHLVIPVLPA